MVANRVTNQGRAMLAALESEVTRSGLYPFARLLPTPRGILRMRPPQTAQFA